MSKTEGFMNFTTSCVTWMVYMVHTASITQVEQEAENDKSAGFSFFIASVPT